MSDRPTTIFISAAEASGDEHAAGLIRALRSRLGDNARFIGAAGEKMAAAGCEVVADLACQASMLGSSVARVPYYWHQVRKLKKAIRRIRPDVLVPVDSPALNWHLAAAAKSAGAPVMYYIAPQVWAWAPWRVRKLARLADRVACILPFEQEYLRTRGVAATHVGHPLFDSLPPRPETLPDLSDAWATGKWQIAMLAGSRPGEIRAHAPALTAVARAVRRRYPEAQFTFTARTQAAADGIRRAVGHADAQQLDITVGRTAQVLSESHFAVAASGTVTLEVAHFGVPMVIFYRAGRALYNLLGRWLIRTPDLSLVNILARRQTGRPMVPELMPWHGDVPQLSEAVLELMGDLGALLEMRQDLLKLVAPLPAGDGRTAADNAAGLVCELLEAKK